ncbi:50S ribosomal protein L29 [Patescibacteria group bacterium]|nr:50S ribosomal protein L29 [Patescibacteria group bacterium]MBU1885469.1 50S ribosomal protein L29 [Patescibacteria group bacterium]
MKRNNIKALHEKTNAELLKQLQELEMKVAQSKLELSAGKLGDTRSISRLRDDIARIKTILREQELLALNQNKIVDDPKKSKKDEGNK